MYEENKINKKIANIGLRAMLYELITGPKPGLVDGWNSGAHTDMDRYSFVDSSLAIGPYLEKFAQIGAEEKDPKLLFSRLRKEGIRAEEAMYLATGSVNTQKGLIFILGLIAAGSSYNLKNLGYWSEEALVDIIRVMTQGLVDRELGSLEEKEDLSNGEKLFKSYGSLGIRGEVEAGLPTVIKYGLPAFRKAMENYESFNLAGLETLMLLMYKSEDTNVLKRSGEAGFSHMKKVSRNFILKGGMAADGAIDSLREIDQEFIEKNISPGGSADLLATTIMIYLLEEEFKKMEE